MSEPEEKTRSPTLGERLKAYRDQNVADRPSFTGQLAAMWREGLKDVRDTFNQVFFGQGDPGHEVGTPLAPTQRTVHAQLGDKDKKLTLYGAIRGPEKEGSVEPNQPAQAAEEQSYEAMLDAKAAESQMQAQQQQEQGMER